MDDRSRFADFLERLADRRASSFEWSRFVVAHYADPFLEEMRRCTVRLMQNRLPYHGDTEPGREALRCWAMALRSASAPPPTDGVTLSVAPHEAAVLDDFLRIEGAQPEQDDAALYRRLKRDVCLLYHELSDYRHIMGDLDYASDYPLEYWALINRIDTGREDDRFIRAGILVLLLAMLQDVFDGSGDHISRHARGISRELERFVPEDDAMLRLVESVEHGLGLLANSASADDRFGADVCWAYDTFVRKYFADAAS
ncbi:MAG: hypothetical protein KDB14_30295 [Planctomycetales bacterium]|nr:hypothetical protein [Planctomycetales bacterium]